jgi:hypothetical protein
MPPRTHRTAAVSPDVDAVDAVDLLAQELIDSSPSHQKSAAIKAPGKTKPAIQKISTKPKTPVPAEPNLPALAQALVAPNSSSPYADYPFKMALLLAQSDLDIAYNLGKKRQYTALLTRFNHTAFPRAVKPTKRKVRHYRVHVAKLSSQCALVIKQADTRIKSLKKTMKGKVELTNMDVDFDPSLFISSGTFRSSPSPPSLVSSPTSFTGPGTLLFPSCTPFSHAQMLTQRLYLFASATCDFGHLFGMLPTWPLRLPFLLQLRPLSSHYASRMCYHICFSHLSHPLTLATDKADPEPKPATKAKGKGKAAKPAFDPMDEISGSDSSDDEGAGLVSLEEGTSVSDGSMDDESNSDNDDEEGDSSDDAVVVKKEHLN